MPLYHYTCEHGHDGIMRDGVIRPAIDVATIEQRKLLRRSGAAAMTAQVIWLTTNPHIVRLNINQVGLGMSAIEALTGQKHCDRTVHRYEITEEDQPILPWALARQKWPVRVVAELESIAGAKPDTWWISRGPLHAHYSPSRQVVA
jgi:hypothetical protein